MTTPGVYPSTTTIKFSDVNTVFGVGTPSPMNNSYRFPSTAYTVTSPVPNTVPTTPNSNFPMDRLHGLTRLVPGPPFLNWYWPYGAGNYPGSYNWVSPVTGYAKIIIVAGGGAGSNGGEGYGGGGGGGGGVWYSSSYLIRKDVTYTITTGMGGDITPGGGNPGANSSISSPYGTITAYGGGGGGGVAVPTPLGPTPGGGRPGGTGGGGRTPNSLAAPYTLFPGGSALYPIYGGGGSPGGAGTSYNSTIPTDGGTQQRYRGGGGGGAYGAGYGYPWAPIDSNPVSNPNAGNPGGDGTWLYLEYYGYWYVFGGGGGGGYAKKSPTGVFTAGTGGAGATYTGGNASSGAGAGANGSDYYGGGGGAGVRPNTSTYNAGRGGFGSVIIQYMG